MLEPFKLTKPNLSDIDEADLNKKLQDNTEVFMEAINEVFKNVPEHLKYQYIAELGCEILNEGWIPNWDDRSQLKYFIWFKMGSSGFRYHDYAYWSADSLVGSRLCFKKLESAKHLATIINDVFEKFMIIK